MLVVNQEEEEEEAVCQEGGGDTPKGHRGSEKECSLLYLLSFLWPAEGDLWSYKKKAV